MKKVLLASLMLLGIVTNGKAAVGDTFIIDGLKYTVLTEDTDNGTGTVSVGKTTGTYQNDPNLTGEITIPATVVNNNITYQVIKITDMGLYKCSDITKIIFPEGFKEISSLTSYNTSLKEIVIPSTITKLNMLQLRGCSLERITINDLNAYLQLEGSLRWSYGNEPHLYYQGQEVTEITLPENITTVNISNPYITKVNLHKNIQNIQKYYCGQKHIIIPEGVKKIPMDCFNLKTLEELTFPTTLEECQNNFNTDQCILKRVNISDLEAWCRIKFWNGLGYDYSYNPLWKAHDLYVNGELIQELEIPNTITEVLPCSFSGASFTTITFHDDFTKIGQEAFRRCLSLKTIVLNEGLTEIEYGAFQECNNPSPKQITLPASLEIIGGSAFSGCQIEKITFGDKLINLSSLALSNNPLKAVYLPNSIKKIEYSAFVDTSDKMNIQHLTLPSHLEVVQQSFLPKDVQEVTIPKGVIAEDVDNTQPEGVEHYGWTEWLPKNIKSVFIMGDEIPAEIRNWSVGEDFTVYVKESVFREKYPNGQFTYTATNTYDHTTTTYTVKVDYRIPVTMGTTTSDNSTSNFKSMCRDFDADFSDPNVTDPELKVWLAADYNGNNHNVMMQQLNYVPSRLKANVTDPETGELYQGLDEYVGIILEGTPGKTYYYKMGEHDYTQGAEGQWLLEDAQQNFLVGANDPNIIDTEFSAKEKGEKHLNYGLKNGYFKKYSSVGWITYNKSYLSLPESILEGNENYDSKQIGFEFYELDGTTRILSAEEFSSRCEDDIFNGRTYNLQGQAVGDDYKGFVIQNGKKFIRK